MINLKTLSELVNISSFDLKQNKKIINYLTSRFEPFADEIVKLKTPASNKENLLIGINTKLNNVSNAVVLSGHIDTVVASEAEWKTNPCKLTNVSGRVYGLGVIDMKCFFASIIDNIQQIKKLNIPTIIAVSSDEETNLFGIKQITTYFKQNKITPRFTIIGEPTSLKICTSSKSCYEYKVQIKGKSCHSSQPENGINSVFVAAKLISEIEELSLCLEGTTLNVGVVSGGSMINIVPDNAEIKFDIRSKTKKGLKEALSMVKQKIKKLKNQYAGAEIKITQTLAIPALENLKDSFVTSFAKNNNIELNEFLGGAEAGYFQELGGKAILFGAGDLNLAHKPNEYLKISAFEKYNKLLLKMLQLLSENK